jgi:sec-independent protein translocase protein TatA
LSAKRAPKVDVTFVHPLPVKSGASVRNDDTKGTEMLSNISGWHSLIVLAATLLLFGSAKLPALARSVGQSVRILRNETSKDTAEAGPSSNKI